jgi:REP element-mobilizing transposase RayT
MTYPRAHLVDSENGGFYHCISRCVRRAWQCGQDVLTGRSYEHRRAWVESRILHLSEIFSVELYAYAVMSNHYHLVLKVSPKDVNGWDDDEVAERWCRLKTAPGEAVDETLKSTLLSSEETLLRCRERLGSLSWFMRYLNEPIARQANREDHCKGRFWEGRFKSIALLDEAAVLACMAYVDLNPVRAGISDDVTHSSHTSVRSDLPPRHRTPS